MNNLETVHISKCNSFKKHILYWYRYVDDVFAVFQGNETEIKKFVSEINNLHQNITFTYELETNNSLPFLDLKVHRNLNNISFEIHHKNTSTDHIIPYDSYHPTTQKLSAFHSFFNRLFSIPLSVDNFNQEHNYILTLANNNGFPLNLISKLYYRHQKRFVTSKLTTLCKGTPDSCFFFSLPFLPPISNTIQNSLKHKNVKISLKPLYNLRSLLPSTKTKTDIIGKCGVYKLLCNTCNMVYIGKTERTFKTRFREHQSLINVKHLSNSQDLRIKSNFAHHVLTKKHNIDEKSHGREFLHISHNRST